MAWKSAEAKKAYQRQYQRKWYASLAPDKKARIRELADKTRKDRILAERLNQCSPEEREQLLIDEQIKKVRRSGFDARGFRAFLRGNKIEPKGIAPDVLVGLMLSWAYSRARKLTCSARALVRDIYGMDHTAHEANRFAIGRLTRAIEFPGQYHNLRSLLERTSGDVWFAYQPIPRARVELDALDWEDAISMAREFAESARTNAMRAQARAAAGIGKEE